jgi:hypothetical protein
MNIVPPAAPRPRTPVQTPLTRTDTSIVRCGRCGSTQIVDLSQPVMGQVRPFVHAHLACGPDALATTGAP